RGCCLRSHCGFVLKAGLAEVDMAINEPRQKKFARGINHFVCLCFTRSDPFNLPFANKDICFLLPRRSDKGGGAEEERGHVEEYYPVEAINTYTPQAFPNNIASSAILTGTPF